MTSFTFSDIMGAAQGRLVGKETLLAMTNISTDSRSLQPNSLFCALRGVNFDGHQFVVQAFQKGALASLIDERAWNEMPDLRLVAERHPLIVVNDVCQALGRMAQHHRQKFKFPMIGVTGSAGKTTTKECLAAVLRYKRKVFVGSGNFNNHIGLPLNLLKLSSEDRMAVIEMGAGAQGDIRYLCSIAKPSIGVITNIHPAHLKGFGSLDGIYQTKLEIADSLKDSGGTLFVFGDDPKLVALAKSKCANVRTFGKIARCDYRVSGETQDGEFIKFTINQKYSFRLKGYGLFNVMNAVAALGVAEFLGDDLNELTNRWREFVSVPNRFQIEDFASPKIRIVKDCYNANPQAFSVAIQSFLSLSVAGKKIIVVGDMKELGAEAEKYHHRLGCELAEHDYDFLILIGEYSNVVALAIQEHNYKIPIMQCSSNQQIAEFLRTILTNGDAVLLKGSRSMRLEEVVDILKYEFRTQEIV